MSEQGMGALRVEVPDIGDADEVGVVEILVSPGTAVEREQGLIVLESDKASLEVPSPAAGTVREVVLKVGDKVEKGTLILWLEPSEPSDKSEAENDPQSSSKPAKAPPSAGRKSGQKPEQKAEQKSEPKSKRASKAPPPESDDEPGADSEDSESDPEELTIEAPPSARSGGPTRTVPPPPALSGASLSPPPAPPQKKPHASPSVRQLARELGVDLAHVPGSAPRGRITREDVQRYVKHAMSVAGTATGTGFAVPELPEIDFTQFGEVTTEPLTKIQKLSGRNLHRSWVTIPHVTQFDEADITELEAFRQKMRADRPDVKLTVTSFFMKALVVVLRNMPRFNSSLDKSGENLIYKHYFHMGVAVDTPNGLVVPVIRDVDVKGLSDLAVELSEVSDRARRRRLAPSDLQGGCFTLSSLGGIGGTAFTPIINPPEVCVLGVSRAQTRPVYVGGKLEPRLMVGLSLSYDHRVIDGADAVRFTTRLREVLSDIRQMLL
jgi:pyruvate dehydrogenase E2 component (dihydrolipoamide acetyltransferase)